jgi:hypothetical protein
LPQLVPVTAIQPKAAILNVGPGTVLPVQKPFVIEGYAWAGENAVAKVEVSIDGGKTWAAAKVDKAEPFKAARWRATFTPMVVGPLNLLARCTDSKGNTQPEKRDADRRTYMINHLVPVEVTVK